MKNELLVLNPSFFAVSLFSSLPSQMLNEYVLCEYMWIHLGNIKLPHLWSMLSKWWLYIFRKRRLFIHEVKCYTNRYEQGAVTHVGNTNFTRGWKKNKQQRIQEEWVEVMKRSWSHYLLLPYLQICLLTKFICNSRISMMILWSLKNMCRVTKNLRCLAPVFPTKVKRGDTLPSCCSSHIVSKFLFQSI